MKNLINILSVLLFVFSIISCGNNENNKNSDEKGDTLPADVQIRQNQEKALFSSIAEDFQYNNDASSSLNITNLIISDRMDYSGNRTVQAEVLQLVKGKRLVFTSNEASNEEVLLGKYSQDYEIAKKGMIKIGDDDYSASFYYNDMSSLSGRTAFQGIMIVSLSTIESLPEEELIILIKGRK